MKRMIISAGLLAASAFSFSAPAVAETQSLVVAGGCFWCVEADFDKMDGVLSTVSGYAGGEMDNPTYKNHGQHREVVRVEYDDTATDYRTLVSNFLRTIDPTDAGGQFCDRGRSYTTAIHAANEEEAEIAREEVAEGEEVIGRDIVTPVEGPVTFWKAEDYHQNYYKSEERTLTRFGYVTRAEAYKGYRKGCGRDQRVRDVWGDEAFQGMKMAGS